MCMKDMEQYPVESHLSPVKAHTFSRSNGWWRAIVESEDNDRNTHVRFYLWRDQGGKDWDITHKWNIQPDRWKKEKQIVGEYLNKQPNGTHPYFPVQYYKVVGGETIMKNERWWSAVVQFKKNPPSSKHSMRLYLWKFKGDKPKDSGFKWNVEKDTWHQESMMADQFLSD